MAKLGKVQLDRLLRDGFEGVAWDDAVRGFGVRVRKGRASFFVKTRLETEAGSVQRWISIGPFAGTTQRRGKGLTPDEARTKALEKLNEVAKGVDPTAVKRAKVKRHAGMPTLAEVAASYLKEGCLHLAPSSVEDRRSILREGGPVLGAFGSMKIDAIRRPQLLEWWGAKGEGSSVSQKTKRNWLDVLSAVLAFAVERELGIDSNPVDAARAVLRTRNRTKGGRALSDPSRNIRPIESADELERLLAASAARPWIDPEDKRGNHDGDGYLTTLLLLDAGLRLGEVCGLTWGDVALGRDVDDPSRRLEIAQTRARGRHDGAPKSGRARKVQLSRRLRSALQARFLAAGRPVKTERVLPGLDPANYRRRHFARACQTAKLGARSPKDLRDTYASQLLSAGVQLGYVSQQLGHADVSVTARHYARWVGAEYRSPMTPAPGEVPADLLSRLPKIAELGAVEVAS